MRGGRYTSHGQGCRAEGPGATSTPHGKGGRRLAFAAQARAATTIRRKSAGLKAAATKADPRQERRPPECEAAATQATAKAAGLKDPALRLHLTAKAGAAWLSSLRPGQ